QLKATLNIVQKIKHHTGCTWSNEHGTGITPLSASSWDAFVAKKKNAKLFQNAGWPYLKKMENLM
ncbi:hypothetical protein GYMLUDRAFT_119934, partial [Collybiopsis luxurians FD-317 M1]